MPAHRVKPVVAGAVSAPLARRTALESASTPAVITTTVAPAAMSARVVRPVKVARASVQEVPRSAAASAVRLVNHAGMGVVVFQWA